MLRLCLITPAWALHATRIEDHDPRAPVTPTLQAAALTPLVRRRLPPGIPAPPMANGWTSLSWAAFRCAPGSLAVVAESNS
jgi:hypothetical protein